MSRGSRALWSLAEGRGLPRITEFSEAYDRLSSAAWTTPVS